MIKISEVCIERYRSINKIEYPLCLDTNIISLCGRNNVGKTNSLRAINLFFNPDLYDRTIDMPKIKKATGGAAIHPKITITFYDDEERKYYRIIRDFSKIISDEMGIKGESYILQGKKKSNKTQLSNDQICGFLGNIEFAYIESINVLMPELIERLTSDVMDAQYSNSRFSETKKVLKESYDTYIDVLKEILEKFGRDISDTFRLFKPDWSVKFLVPKNSESFRELITDDIKLQLDDSGSIGIEDKGAGLQRLATIILQLEMLARLGKKKNIILCVDEPDVYLHEGLQIKLKSLFEQYSSRMQIFLTSHSRIFINSYSMKNVFLLTAKNYTKHSERKKQDVGVIETYLIDVKSEAGYKEICEHLGIENKPFEPLQKYNIVVEGECDKKYIEELGHFFNITIPNIICLNGADNAIRYLDFYNSFYLSENNEQKPCVKLLLDNDVKGREVYNSINGKKQNYEYIDLELVFVQNYLGDIDLNNKNVNIEIEDLLYPELICYLINMILKKMGMKKINERKICEDIKKDSFKGKGILSLCEHSKDESNPDDGLRISFVSSNRATNSFKNSLAGAFKIQANKKMLELIDDCSKRYPYVEQFIKRLCTWDDNG